MLRKTFYISASFAAGLALMTLELVSARLVAPVVGSSVFTWTSVIGVTLLGLSVGSYIGGALIDRYSFNKTLFAAFLLSASTVFLVYPFSLFSPFLAELDIHIFGMILLLSGYLFFLPSFAIGTLQPMILKLYADSFSDIGKEYGLLSAMWSLGSILGVFLTGFYFVSSIGSKVTLWIVTGILLVYAGIFFWVGRSEQKVFRRYVVSAFVLFILFALVFGSMVAGSNKGHAAVVYEDETDYFLARVIDADIPGFGPSRVLFLDFDSHSIEPTGESKSVLTYTDMYPIFQVFNDNIKSIHVIGAGAYTLPNALARTYPSADVSVSELDPEVLRLAEEYFTADERIRTYVGDARVLFTKDDERYDLVFGDAYNSFISVPWHLATREFNDLVRSRLTDGGVYAVNFISSIKGQTAAFFQSMVRTFSVTFPEHYIVAFGSDPEDIQNIVLIGVNGDTEPTVTVAQQLAAMEGGVRFSELLVDPDDVDLTGAVLLTDDFAPTEKLMMPVIDRYFSEYNKFYRSVVGGDAL